MPEPSKFSGALAKLKQSPPEQPSEQADKQQTPIADEPAGKRGRPAGKSSNPDYTPTTVLLRKKTKRLAQRKLEDLETKEDLSDLIEKLLASWINT